jgi:hypothetical protein
MSQDGFIALLCGGLGLSAAAALNLAWQSAGAEKRAVLSTSAAAGAILLSWLLTDHFTLAAPLALLFTAALMPVHLLGLPWSQRMIAGLARRAARPLAVWWVCGAAGLAGLLASAVLFEELPAPQPEPPPEIAKSLDELERRHPPRGHVAADVQVATDRGTAIALWVPLSPRGEEEQEHIEELFIREKWYPELVLRQGPPDDRVNCFGWIFTGGRYWLPFEDDVELILQDNGYKPVKQPKADDLVIYRRDGIITHVAIVRFAGGDHPPLVEGKWGYGAVYLHRADQSLYGTEYTFMRSPRGHHVLRGLETPVAGAKPPGPHEDTE